MTDNPDFLEELVADEPANRRLASELRSWRDSHSAASVTPDSRLAASFSHEPTTKRNAPWRLWMQRPAIVFGVSFAAVFLLGIGAFALVARDSGGSTVAATTSSVAAFAAVDETPGEITLPSDLSEQKSYATCVINELTTWFTGGLAAEEAPDITATCGTLSIPDLGAEAEAFRSDLQVFANCLTGELNSILPQLPTLMGEGHDGLADLENKCGEPPDPRDYGLAMPFADFNLEDLDLSQFDFGEFNFGDLDLKDLNLDDVDLEELFKNLPEGMIPEDFDLEELRSRLGDFKFDGFQFDLECDPDGAKQNDTESLDDFDIKSFFEEFEDGHLCGIDLSGLFDLKGLDLGQLDLEGLNFGDLEGLNLEDFDFGDLDLEKLFADFEAQYGDLKGMSELEGVDFDELLKSLLGNSELDLDSLFAELSQPSA